MWWNIYVCRHGTLQSSLNPDLNTHEPDRPQHDCPSVCVIAQQYSSANFVSFRFRSRAFQIRVFFKFFKFSWFVKSLCAIFGQSERQKDTHVTVSVRALVILTEKQRHTWLCLSVTLVSLGEAKRDIHNCILFIFTVVTCILMLSKYLFTNWCTRELL
jgi:hypothetical protein